MKKHYIKPMMYAETFVPNQYVAACGDTITTVPAMEVRCQSDGHYNIARDTIFADSNAACVGKYNASLTNDKCHYNHGGEEGTGFVRGNWTYYKNDQWFVESSRGSQTAYKGYFSQGGHRHLFYATTEQASQFQGS